MEIELTRTSVAAAIGMFTSSAFFGGMAITTFWACPALALPYRSLSQAEENDKTYNSKTSKQLAQQWKLVYDNGKKQAPFLAVLGASSWLYVASILPSHQSTLRYLYIAGAVLNVSIAPFTRTVMSYTVGELSRRATDEKPEDKLSETVAILDRWSWENLLRGSLPLAGLFCVLFANVKR